MIEITINTKSPYKTIKYLNKENINLYDIKYHKDRISLKIDQKDLNKVDKFYNYKITKLYGKKELLRYTKINKTSLIYLIIFNILIITYTRIIIDINIISENTNLISLIKNELDKNGISKYSLVKNSKQINNIKEKILNNNKDQLEWINIERKGMKYTINLESRITKNKVEEKKYCNIISTKDATITKVITHKGVELLKTNDSVKKGDTIITGDIIYNDSLKKQVCATGNVYGNTWYTINITIPISHEKIKKLNKVRSNIIVQFNNKKYKIFKSRLTNYISENKKIVSIFGFQIYYSKEYEVKKTISLVKEDELTKLLNKKITTTMKHTLQGDAKIIEQKVLKKHVNNSTIDLEIFIVAEELISKQIYY